MDQTKNWEDFYFHSRDNHKLYCRKYEWDDKSKPVVVCLPGLTRNAADFHNLATHLSSSIKFPFRVLSMDYRGRGLSDYDKDWNNYNPLTEAEDVVAGLTALDVGHVHMIGTSRGGLIAMILAATRPGMLKSVVLNDVGPEIDGKGLVRIKSYMERSKPPKNRQEARDNLKAYASAQFPKFDDDYWDRQVDLIYEEREGSLIARYDPKLVNTLKAINLDEPLVSLWPQFTGLRNLPVLLIRGANSDLLSKQTVAKMAGVHRALEIVEVPDQGHAPDLGTAQLPEKIFTFLNR